MKPSPIHVPVHVHVHVQDPRIGRVLAILEAIIQQEEETMSNLDALREEIASNTDVSASVAALVNRLADEIEATGADQGAIDDLVAQLRSNDTSLADLVTANTPADTGGGEPAPEPAPAPETPPADTGEGAPEAGGTPDTPSF